MDSATSTSARGLGRAQVECLDDGLGLPAEVGRGVVDGPGGDDQALGAVGQDQVVIEEGAALAGRAAAGGDGEGGREPVDPQPDGIPVRLGEPALGPRDDLLAVETPDLLEGLAVEFGV